MTKRILLLTLVLLLAGTLLAQAPAPTPQAAQKPATEKTIATVLDRSITSIERHVVPAADAMPEDKFSFAPTNGEFKGVRNFGSQIKHIAATNYMFFAAMLEEKPPVDVNGENGPDSIKTKAEIMKYLKDSFAYGHKAIATITEKNAIADIKSPFGQGTVNRLSLAVLTYGHCYDHYGQMVEYLRMNGIIPPASRPRQ